MTQRQQTAIYRFEKGDEDYSRLSKPYVPISFVKTISPNFFCLYPGGGVGRSGGCAVVVVCGGTGGSGGGGGGGG
ncbi:Hypothetical predicted protein [Octopus vulgaris]|uniref:Uncharacterized protein n=1 Tax=Octopus vulgaris TaxID=6645 RepID=A0AA36BC06_OCTVU|nr:Hypothetical predicted protein [Octopus vulgaris]